MLKYRYRIVTGEAAEEVSKCIKMFSDQKGCEVVELNVQVDHVNLVVMAPPKVSISNFVAMVKGRTAIRIFNKFRLVD